MSEYQKPIKAMLGGFSAQFVLGVALSTLATFDPAVSKTPTVWHVVFLVLHVLIALWLLIGAVMLVRQLKQGSAPGSLKRLAWLGLTFVVGAIVSGVLVVSGISSEIFSFAMAICFLGGFIAYGRMLLQVSKAPAAQG